MMFNPVDNFMFSAMPVFVGIVFFIVIGIFIFTIGKGISEYASNKSKPVETVPAKVIGKRPHTWGGTGDTSAHTSYYITFELENGERLELPVNDKFYGMHIEGDVGMLTHQGTQMMSFEREIV
jgi:hypothetical protein